MQCDYECCEDCGEFYEQDNYDQDYLYVVCFLYWFYGVIDYVFLQFVELFGGQQFDDVGVEVRFVQYYVEQE